MCYLVTAINPSATSSGRLFQIFDTEAEARTEAERLIRAGHNEAVVWKQIAVPRVETSVVWEQQP